MHSRELENSIREAFPAEENVKLFTRDLSDLTTTQAGSLQYLLSRQWNEIGRKDFWTYSESFGELTDEALAYFLPAFLIFSLKPTRFFECELTEYESLLPETTRDHGLFFDFLSRLLLHLNSTQRKVLHDWVKWQAKYRLPTIRDYANSVDAMDDFR